MKKIRTKYKNSLEQTEREKEALTTYLLWAKVSCNAGRSRPDDLNVEKGKRRKKMICYIGIIYSLLFFGKVKLSSGHGERRKWRGV
jgi:hypothetical protein